ncbi:hypothetical protein V5799_017769 [Amblyomma americanum]|uniref:Uncharacterized protein n=1 Tax=Amblyomma americanum TaxID=6943 RepID=A0AAQ4F2B0_AMBAM
MWTSRGALPSPAVQPFPGENSDILAVDGGSEGHAAVAAVLTPKSSTPVTSRYACSSATAFAMASDAGMTPLPVAIGGLTYDGSPTTPATHLFPAECSGDRFLGGGFGRDAAAMDMRSHRQSGHWIQPPSKSSASPVPVAAVSRRKIINRACAGTILYTTTSRSLRTSAVKQAVQSITLRRELTATALAVLRYRRSPVTRNSGRHRRLPRREHPGLDDG